MNVQASTNVIDLCKHSLLLPFNVDQCDAKRDQNIPIPELETANKTTILFSVHEDFSLQRNVATFQMRTILLPER